MSGTGLQDYMERDIEKLRELFLTEDPSGLEEMVARDDFIDVIVEKVRKGDAGYEITVEGSLGTFLPMPEGKKIVVGDTLRFYMSGPLFGGRRHGWAVNGEVIEYETPWDRFATRMAMLARRDHERRENFAKVKPDIDRWYTMLRRPYRDRIDLFRAEKTDFDLNGGAYEIYPVLMAQRIEDWCREQTETPEGPLPDEYALYIIKQFRDLSHDEQKPVIHGEEEDAYGISGHQFDCACALARFVLAGSYDEPS